MNTTPTLTQLLILVLATSQILEVWRHGKIMAEWRAWMETQPFGQFVSDATLCTFCCSVWVAWSVTLLDISTSLWVRAKVSGSFDIVQNLFLVWLLGLAVARAANLVNDLTHSCCRTPK